ncbi:MAG TPA: hypothetical protein PLD79_01985, partial [Halothiobacillus sp.]|nr:hypothetical protein [Halothiobacillus sp.]
PLFPTQMHYIDTQTHKQEFLEIFLYSTKGYAIFIPAREWVFLEKNRGLQIIAYKAHEEYWRFIHHQKCILIPLIAKCLDVFEQGARF